MAAPGIPLTVAGGGMTRLRTKGAALKNSLYQLTNGYVTMAQTVKARPGTFRTENLAELADPGATVGLTFYKDVFNVFSDQIETVPEGYLCNVLIHPAVSEPHSNTQFNNASSLLHFEDGNGSTAFTDNGGILPAPAWAATGAGVVETTATSKFGTGSLVIPSASAGLYISTPITAGGNMDFSFSDFTFEGWFNTSTWTNGQQLWSVDNGVTQQWYLRLDATGVLEFVQLGIDSGSISTAAAAFTKGVWNHVAVTRYGATITMWLNGVSVGTYAGVPTLTPITAGSSLNLGGSPVGGTVGLAGNIDDFRLVIGIAAYTAAFTPPTASLTASVAQAASTIPTLLHFDDGTNSFVDSGLSPSTWTSSGTNGSATETATQSKFGSGSLEISGWNAFINAPSAAGSQLDITANDYTVEAWIYPTTATLTNIAGAALAIAFDLAGTSGDATMFRLQLQGSTPSTCAVYAQAFGNRSSGSVNTPGGVLTINGWNHVAVMRRNDILTLAVNGVIYCSGTQLSGNDTALPMGSTLKIGAGNTSPFQSNGFIDGFIDEFQITNGVAKYGGPANTYTLPAQPTGSTALSVPIPVKQIHFAAPFMGFLYVVAEFDINDSAILAEFGDTYHFWLQSSGSWAADTVYLPSDLVTPTPPNGLAYQATRLVPPNSLWAPNNQITLNQIVEPTTPNGYMFKAIAVEGVTPHTGTVEPSWPKTVGAVVQEFGDYSSLNTSAVNPVAGVQVPSSAVTDRYGNPYTPAPDNTTGEAVPTIAASTTVNTWKPGILTNPGAVVVPTTNQGAFIDAVPNGDFENGPDSNWVLSDGDVTIIDTGGHAYAGTYYVQFALTMDTDYCTMNTAGVVKPGQSVSASAYLNPNNQGANMTMWLNMLFYDGSDTLISTVKSAPQQGVGYRQTTVGAKAPANAAGVRLQIESSTGTHSINGSFGDHVSWNLETAAAASPFLFEAIQSAAGTTAATEPTWPSGSGDTVVDGGVTWEAVGSSIITWQAIPIMESGDTQPTFPTTVGIAVADGNMSWVCTSRQITDKNCPQTKVVAIGQSKVYAIDNDLIPFCATANPLDWTSQFDAGYLPFGMQTYGSEPVAVLGLYRSNLVAMNSLGYQMWQIDPDPANMALLDAQPVGSTFPLSMQPVQNDLVFLNARGIRSLGISGASGNVQAGQFGKNLDPLVLASIAAGGEPLGEPVGLFYPGTGQYWLIFGTTIYVQTNNGSGNANSWSVYEFPDPISYWTISDGELYLRAGDLVWHVHEDALYDDIQDSSDPDSNSIPFTGEVTWPYLDLGTPGVDKDFEGVNIVCDGTGELAVGYDQSNFALATAPIAFDGDTLPGIGMIPIPMNAPTFQIRLTWDAGQAWEWEMTEIYLTGSSGT